jgi:hypothetical protein
VLSNLSHSGMPSINAMLIRFWERSKKHLSEESVKRIERLFPAENHSQTIGEIAIQLNHCISGGGEIESYQLQRLAGN